MALKKQEFRQAMNTFNMSSSGTYEIFLMANLEGAIKIIIQYSVQS